MLRNIVFSIFVLLAYLIQTTFYNALELSNVVPNIVIIIVCMYGMFSGRRSGLIFGFFTGLLIDVFYGYGEVIGLNALLYMYVGFFNGIFKDIIYIKNYHVPIILVGLSDFAVAFLSYVVMFVMRNRLDLAFYFRNIMFPEMIYTIFVGLLLYRPLLYIHERLYERERRSETTVD
jgi:rod shape-determining protein MreD